MYQTGDMGFQGLRHKYTDRRGWCTKPGVLEYEQNT